MVIWRRRAAADPAGQEDDRVDWLLVSVVPSDDGYVGQLLTTGNLSEDLVETLRAASGGGPTVSAETLSGVLRQLASRQAKLERQAGGDSYLWRMLSEGDTR